MRSGYAGGQARQAFGDISRWLDYPGYEEMFAAGAEHNLALSFLMANDDLPDLERMCKRFPETPVILDHVCGCRIREEVFPEEQVQKLCAMARHRRVMVKLGPFQGLGDGQAPYLDLLPLIERVVNAFGPERCMFESNFPVDRLSVSYQVMWNGMKKIVMDFSDAEKQAMFYGTAARVYRL